VRAIHISRLDGPTAIELVDIPEPDGADRVVIDVHAAGVTFPEVLQSRGQYQMEPTLPFVPGSEVAGIVRAAPGGSGFRAGERVAAFPGIGGFAEVVAAEPRMVFRLPEATSFEAAAAMPMNYLTVHFALTRRGRLREGEQVLVHGAAGGVGTAAVQLAIAAGASVVATVRNPEQREVVAGLGATVVEPERFGAHGPFDVVLELIGGPNLAADLEALAVGGRISVIGVGAGARAEVNLLGLMAKRGRIHGSTLRARPLEGKAAAARAVERHVLPLLAGGTIGVPVAATFPMASAADAYERFRAGNKFGKIVLTNDT
jgi:NADPH2:quinone reductase